MEGDESVKWSVNIFEKNARLITEHLVAVNEDAWRLYQDVVLYSGQETDTAPPEALEAKRVLKMSEERFQLVKSLTDQMARVIKSLEKPDGHLLKPALGGRDRDFRLASRKRSKILQRGPPYFQHAESYIRNINWLLQQYNKILSTCESSVLLLDMQASDWMEQKRWEIIERIRAHEVLYNSAWNEFCKSNNRLADGLHELPKLVTKKV